jgi:hypothetical protein
MLISGDTLVSDCHEAMIYMEGTEYRCIRCMKHCQSAGTLSEVTERRNAISNERARLEREVIEAAKAYGRAARAVEDHMKKATEDDGDSAAGWQLLRDMESKMEDLLLEAVWPLIEFESKQK